MVISAEGVTKRFGRFTAIDRLSLEVRRGEIYGFVGLNGAGKTTTIRILLGMLRPTEGITRLFDTVVEPGSTELWRRVGYMVESPSAYPELTVLENLEVARRLRDLPDRRMIDQIIDRLGLNEYRDRKARHLSMGNRQRLGLAKALIHEPDLLILDEPTNGLDPAGIIEVRELLRALADEGVAIFLSSHILSEVARLVTHLGIIDEGRLIAEADSASLSRLLGRQLVLRTRPGEESTARAALEAAGLEVAVEVRGAGERTALVLRGRRAVDDPGGVATLLVEAGAPPVHLEVEEEELEAFFLRTIEESR